MSMKKPLDPDALQAYEELQSLFALLVGAMESSAGQTKTAFAEYFRKPIDRQFFPHLFRYFLKCTLLGHGQNATEIDDEELLSEPELARNGLLLTCGGNYLRILKAADGGLPPAGESKRRQDYYNHVAAHHQTQLDLGEIAKPEPRNLVVLWDVTPRFDLGAVDVVRPQAGSADETSVGEQWRFSIFSGTASGSETIRQELPRDLNVTRRAASNAVPPEIAEDDIEEAK